MDGTGILSFVPSSNYSWLTYMIDLLNVAPTIGWSEVITEFILEVFGQLASTGCFVSSPFCCIGQPLQRADWLAHVQLPAHFMVDFGYVAVQILCSQGATQ